MMGLKSQIINSLKNPVENIYISAKYLSDLRDIQYLDLTADNASDEQIRILGTRYNRGPNISLEQLLNNSLYGQRIFDDAKAIEEMMKYKN